MYSNLGRGLNQLFAVALPALLQRGPLLRTAEFGLLEGRGWEVEHAAAGAACPHHRKQGRPAAVCHHRLFGHARTSLEGDVHVADLPVDLHPLGHARPGREVAADAEVALFADGQHVHDLRLLAERPRKCLLHPGQTSCEGDHAVPELLCNERGNLLHEPLGQRLLEGPAAEDANPGLALGQELAELGGRGRGVELARLSHHAHILGH
mmetsp:Transcript_80952/g.203702  ORF Transcript_80952/g.203702 Transcript_80952/m.203702 type:complete len:208 (+) Transcript_80952:49-672(+)